MLLKLFLALLLNTDIATSEPLHSSITLKQEPISPIPLQLNIPANKIELGKKLFEDPLLSHNQKQACSHCHLLKQKPDGSTYIATTQAINNSSINTPSMFNMAFNARHTWHGKFKTLESQAEAALLNPNLANSNWAEILTKLGNNPEYITLFSDIYNKDNINKQMVLNAIVSYEKSLITPNAPFDKYLRGNLSAISAQAKKGYQLFKAFGCISCHQGINIGGNMFQKLGVFHNYFKHRGNITKVDHGRFNITGHKKDQFVFRVPSLRNIAVTAPYFHDGQAKTLEDALDIMARHQLGRKISKQDKADIIIFLHSLTGEYQEKPLSKE